MSHPTVQLFLLSPIKGIFFFFALGDRELSSLNIWILPNCCIGCHLTVSVVLFINPSCLEDITRKEIILLSAKFISWESKFHFPSGSVPFVYPHFSRPFWLICLVMVRLSGKQMWRLSGSAKGEGRGKGGRHRQGKVCYADLSQPHRVVWSHVCHLERCHIGWQ